MFKNLILLLVLFLVVVGVFKVLSFRGLPNPTKAEIIPAALGDAELSLKVAKTPASRTKGLSSRENLIEGQGLLFVFPKEGNYGFWMKDMKFPIDIIWIDKNLRVVGASEDLKPESYPESFYPPKDVQFVLEVPSGFYKRHSLNIGEGLFLKSQNDVLEGVF